MMATFIDYRELNNPGRKTRIWEIEAKAGGFLGRVQWHAHWRCYAFFPARDTLFEETCLQEISDFLRGARIGHKAEL